MMILISKSSSKTQITELYLEDDSLQIISFCYYQSFLLRICFLLYLFFILKENIKISKNTILLIFG
jgi:hypothetical protein